MPVSLNTLQQQRDCLLDLLEWDDWGDNRLTREEMVERYTVAALKAMHRELDAEDLASVTPENIAEWALEEAAAAGEDLRQPEHLNSMTCLQRTSRLAACLRTRFDAR